MIAKITKYLTEVKTELRKVSWSSRGELINSTIVVLITVAILAAFVGICDLFLFKTVSVLFR
ncbi:MAG: preprotein translocase subunit SecE [Candidatus Omnitrophica bacterium]|nr:preprotein translocase subunit SecE [Candidatus Omnitrophota bacterium]